MSRPVDIIKVFSESEILDDLLNGSRWIRIVPTALLGVLGSCSRKRVLDSQFKALFCWLKPALRWVERGDERRRWEILTFGICVAQGCVISLYQLRDLILRGIPLLLG